jgi:hypothetical protein
MNLMARTMMPNDQAQAQPPKAAVNCNEDVQVS